MRMTKQMKDAFVESVMADVPTTDYEEQIRAVILGVAVDALPPIVRRVWDDTARRGYVNTAHFSDWDLAPGVGVHVPSPSRYDALVDLTPEHKARIEELEAARQQQNDTIRSLRAKLCATVESITTTQQLVRLLPEFEQYVPADAPKDRSVPAIANLVADLNKAGWPKGKQA